MKNIFYILLLLPTIIFAQYPSNSGQKITLGEQTTADGLVYRGVVSIDTVTATSKITRANKQDTSAYILLDTVTNLLWHYKIGSNRWIQAGGSTLDTATMLLPYYRAGRNTIIQAADVPTLNQNTTGSAATLTTGRTIQTNLASTSAATFNGSANITPGVTGVLPVANGGTNTSTAFTAGSIVFAGASGTYTQDNSSLFFDNVNNRLGINTTTPTTSLHVVGTSLVTGTSTFTGNSTFNGTLQAQGGLGFYALNSAFNQPEIELSEFSDILWRADRRFTLTGFPSSPATLFSGLFSSLYQLDTPKVNQDTLYIMNINFVGKEGIPVNGMTYGDGHLYISFYGTSNNYDTIIVKTRNNGTWYTATGPVNMTSVANYKVLRFRTNQTNNLTDIEISVSVSSQSVALASINFISNRYGNQELPYVNKYFDANNLYGNLFMRTNTSVNNVRLSGTGNSYIGLTTGNLGIGIEAPTARLDLDTGTTTIAPLKFRSQTTNLLTSTQAGAMEFNGTNLLFTPVSIRHTMNHGLVSSPSLNFSTGGSLAANTHRDITTNLTNAVVGDIVSLGVPNAAVMANTCYTAWVSAAGVVTVRLNNYSTSSITPPTEQTFKIFVTKID